MPMCFACYLRIERRIEFNWMQVNWLCSALDDNSLNGTCKILHLVVDKQCNSQRRSNFHQTRCIAIGVDKSATFRSEWQTTSLFSYRSDRLKRMHMSIKVRISARHPASNPNRSFINLSDMIALAKRDVTRFSAIFHCFVLFFSLPEKIGSMTSNPRWYKRIWDKPLPIFLIDRLQKNDIFVSIARKAPKSHVFAISLALRSQSFWFNYIFVVVMWEDNESDKQRFVYLEQENAFNLY